MDATTSTQSLASTWWGRTLLVVFGLATAATFFVPALATSNMAGPYSIARTLVMLVFIVLVLACRPRHDTADSIAGASKAMRVLAIVIPVLVVVAALAQWFWPGVAGAIVRDPTRGWDYRHAIFVKAAFELAACVIFIIVLVRFIRSKRGKRGWPIAVSAVCAFLALALAGEELSWGQRIFDWATPAGWGSVNAQDETNLHNLASETFQNVWYFGCWILLVLLPFFRMILGPALARTKRFAFLPAFLPPSYFLVIFGVAYGLSDPIVSTSSFPAWTGIHYGSILFTLLATAAVFIYFIVSPQGSPDAGHRLRLRSIVLLAALVVTVIVELFLSTSWDINQGVPTEYLETFIAFGILLWAIVARKQVVARDAEIDSRG